MVRGKITGFCAVLMLFTAACGSSREAAWETTPEAPAEPVTEETQSQREQLLEAGHEAWQQRGDEQQLRAAIEKYEQAAELDPSDADLWVRLARAYYFLADAHLRFQEGTSEQMVDIFEQGIQASERALVALSPEFGERMRAGTRIDEAVSILDASAVPALYWRSSNMGKWGLEKGFATVLSYKDEIRAIMARCLELDPTYFYYGPHRYFGAFFARVPAFAGGDLERSREHFEASLQNSPNYLGTKTLMAEMYAVKSQDRALYERLLNEVLEADPEVIPEVAPENRVEQQRARMLLEEADQRFE